MNPGHFDLQSLRIFLLAAEAGSLTKAASQAHITLSAASKRLAELEKNAECRLFVRQPRGLELTPAGQGLVKHARRVLDAVNTMASELSDYASGVMGHVRISANVSAVIQFLPDDLALFLSQNPKLRINLEEALSGSIVEAVENGHTDIGIFADNVAVNSLEIRPYRKDRLVVLVPAGHPLSKVRTIKFVETLRYNFVGLNLGSSLLRRITDEAVSAGKVLKVNIQVTSFDAVCRMIQAGLGIGILPIDAISPSLLGYSLQAISLEDDWANRTLFLGINPETPLQPEAQKLYDFLSSIAEINNAS
ncbi:GntR family transcriptional regulator [Serratia sp. Leaf50]|nr:GntR family transcriptional regulator [Serratia sp. Leaf50]